MKGLKIMIKPKKIVALASLILALFLLIASTSHSAQKTPAKAERPSIFDPESLKKGQYLGAASCASSNCHGSVKPRNVYSVKQNEYFTWLKQDKHRTQAYMVLFNKKSAQIARNMHINVEPYKSSICLDCHALNVPKNAQARPLDIEEAISCEACHGPAGGWIARHTEDGATHKKSVEAGMTDMRNLVIRAEICLACHLGDSKKTVDHELIAAGHPQLIFELDNYSQVMPAHWLPFTDKRKKQGLEETDGARAWAVGQAVAFREGMLQLARQARSEDWPEFSAMKCYACHHTLKFGAWRQRRGYKFKPGLPHWNPAQYAALRQLVKTLAPDERVRLDEQVERLSAEIAKINTPQEIVVKTATGLAQTMNHVIPEIMQAKFNYALEIKLLRQIANDVPYLIEGEVDTVGQAVLAINSLVSATTSRNSALAKSGINKIVNNLYRDIQDPERFDRAQFAKHMAELQRLLK